jgi:hypothetical protein
MDSLFQGNDKTDFIIIVSKSQQTSLAQIETTSFLFFTKRYSGKLEIAPKKSLLKPYFCQHQTK